MREEDDFVSKYDFDVDGNLVIGGVTLTVAETWEMIGAWTILPPGDKSVLGAIVAQLKSCGYECEAGPLELNEAFIALCTLAEGVEKKRGLGLFCENFPADVEIVK